MSVYLSSLGSWHLEYQNHVPLVYIYEEIYEEYNAHKNISIWGRNCVPLGIWRIQCLDIFPLGEFDIKNKRNCVPLFI